MLVSAIAEKELDGLRDGGPGLVPHPVPPAGYEAMVVDGPEVMEERLEDDEREDGRRPGRSHARCSSRG